MDRKRTSILAALVAVCLGRADAQCIESEQQQLGASDGNVGDAFGVAVDLSGSTALVGAFLHEHAGGPRNAGAAYVLDHAGGVWSETTELLASDAEQGDRFGYAVAIDGDFAAVSAPFADSVLHPGVQDSGAVYIFRRIAGNWTEVQILTVADDNANQLFGHDLELTGDVLVIGAPGEDDFGVDSGSAYVFRYDGVSWNFGAELHPVDATSGQEFGYSVATDGTRVVCGAPEDGVGLSGAAYVFVKNFDLWSEEQKLVPSRAGNNDFYGDTVDVDGSWLCVGSIDEDSNAGVVAMFEFSGVSWQERAELKASDAAMGSEFASRVELDGDGVLVGAFFSDALGTSTSGTAYLFRYGGSEWVEQVEWVASDAATGDFFGLVALDGTRVLVAAAAGDNGEGSVYAYTRFDLSLTTNQDQYAAGDLAEFCTGGAVPGSLVLLYSITPLVFRITRGVADAEGRFEFSAAVPPGLSGLSVQLLSFGFPRQGKLGHSNSRTISFQ